MYKRMMDMVWSVSAPGGDVKVASFNINFFLGQSDVVVLVTAWVEDPACVKFEETLSAEIVKCHIFVHDDELDDGVVSGTDAEGEGLVPFDGFQFLSWDIFCFEFGDLSDTVVGFDDDVVLHFSEELLTLQEGAWSDGDFNLRHI